MRNEDLPRLGVSKENVLNEHGRADGAVASRHRNERTPLTLSCRSVFDIITRHVLNVIPRRCCKYLLTFQQVGHRRPTKDFRHRCSHSFPHFLLHAHAWHRTRAGTEGFGTGPPPPAVGHRRQELLTFHGFEDREEG